MAITVHIPTALAAPDSRHRQPELFRVQPGRAFFRVDEKFPDLKPHLRDEAGEIRRFLNVYVNEEDIRFLGGRVTRSRTETTFLLVPSIAGGTQD